MADPGSADLTSNGMQKHRFGRFLSGLWSRSPSYFVVYGHPDSNDFVLKWWGSGVTVPKTSVDLSLNISCYMQSVKASSLIGETAYNDCTSGLFNENIFLTKRDLPPHLAPPR
ncbi:hypothetical protein DAPPUDRAFT_234050 [Daphnia pulex]|uniref:Uncharacterized protein n=1 Tax=Daphnia pulex TaxID=6669 RepID=E9FUG0_DAPPU|nr:hypothetical protein DAPPUDRAFT_234050 [Daphnia pulex]|eukprot:EFX88720.1 hypothetical protein DAPPUDRAFT_234050 [Daphnia pulex]